MAHVDQILVGRSWVKTPYIQIGLAELLRAVTLGGPIGRHRVVDRVGRLLLHAAGLIAARCAVATASRLAAARVATGTARVRWRSS